MSKTCLTPLVLLMAAMVSLCGSHVGAETTIFKVDFESGDISDWNRLDSPDSSVHALAASTTSSYSGEYGLLITVPENPSKHRDGDFEIFVPDIVPGHRYQVSMWYRCHAPKSQIRLQGVQYWRGNDTMIGTHVDKGNYYQGFPSSTQWRQGTSSADEPFWTAPEDADSLRLRMSTIVDRNADSGWFQIDEIVVKDLDSDGSEGKWQLR